MTSSSLGGKQQRISSISGLLLFLIFLFPCILADISIDKMDTEQYLFVMKSFFIQNQFQTFIWLYLVLLAIQPDTLTNHFCTQ